MPNANVYAQEKTSPAGAPVSPWGRIVIFLPYLVMTLSLLMTWFFWRQYDHSLNVRSQTVFSDRTQEITERFFTKLVDDEQILRGAAGLYNASDDVTRDEWRRYTQSLSLVSNYPGLQGLGFTEVVYPNERERHIRRIRNEGFASYNMWPGGERPFYTAIIYLEPFDWRNRRAFGFDMFSEPVRREAMEQARDRGEAAVTSPVVLVQEIEKDTQKGILMYMPVYRQGAAIATVAQRRDALKGFVYSPIRMLDFMSANFPKGSSDIGFRIFTEKSENPGAMLFDSTAAWKTKVPSDYRSDLTTSLTVHRFGRDWLFSFHSLPAFAMEQRRGQSRGYLAGGLTVSLLLTVIAFMLRSAHASAIAAAQAINESRERYRKISEDSPAYISTTLPDGTITYANPALAAGTGMTQAEMIGKNFLDFLLPEYREQVRRALSATSPENPTCTTEQALNGPDGSVSWHQWTNRAIFDEQRGLIGFQAVGQDITERKRAEEERARLEQQMVHAQKMESLGVLAGGVAHDFNNILMAIIGNVDLSLMALPDDSPVVANLNRIQQAATRAADLAKQMLAYSGKGRFFVGPVDLNRVVKDLEHILEGSLSDRTGLELELHIPLPDIEADVTQIQQILMNLVMNASEAIGDGRGEIVITTGVMEMDRTSLKDVLLGEQMEEGNYVFLEVSDNGCGMEREMVAKIFDPFFTTKFTGRGLGLAAVHGIVRGHKGGIKVYSEPGKGSVFRVLFPQSHAPGEEKGAPSPAADGWQGEGKVLLVDDEEVVRSIASALLTELGYTPLLAESGEEALALYRDTKGIQAVILDLTMPHMDGEACFRALRLLDPEVKVIMSSGFSEHDVVEKFNGGLAGFIQKPYTLGTLRAVMKKV
ncbi:CHASE domain-containing protein [Geomonas oryzae]|uniref:CHASE domain-containing protein n=1 Tax=Geomonas oryzae TaxID=2364273 RepID=UPI00100AB60B|nr:CHASE domain-containing protein [Geomonas oryzae]